MKYNLLLIFVILLLIGIIILYLRKKLYMEGMQNSSYTGKNGENANIITNADGSTSIIITHIDGTTTQYNSDNKSDDISSNIYYGPNNSSAKIISTSNGSKSITITTVDGKITSYNYDKRDTSNNNNNDISPHTYDNYNHYDGSSYPTVFYGTNGATAQVIKTSTNNTLVITNKNGTTQIYYIDQDNQDTDITSYYGPNGNSAKIVTDNNGKQSVEIATQSGSKVIYYQHNLNTNNIQDDTINQYSPDTNNTGADYNTAYNVNTYTGPYGGNTKTINGPSGNTYSTYDSSAYYNSLPQGIPKSQIPYGQEDLYILKSQIVPPVCPKCPDQIIQQSNTDVTKCPPCPPCSRCPEPAFDCKKVPNYNAFNPDYMPVPVMNSFSSFGM